MTYRKRLSVSMLALCCALATGCGYSTRPLIRDDIRYVYVPVFDNKTFRRGLEKPLTVAVVDEIKRHSRLRIVSRQSADSVLSGEIVAVDENVVTKAESDEILSKRVTVSVKFRWTDNLTKRDIVPPQTVAETVRFVPRLGEPFLERAWGELAQRIVERMQESW